MDYSRNCNFVLGKSNNNLVVKNNKINAKVDNLKIFRVYENKKFDGKKALPAKDFFNQNSEGIYLVKVGYKKADKSKNIKYIKYSIKIENRKLILQRSKYPRDLSGTTEIFQDEIFSKNTNAYGIDNDDYMEILKFYIINNPSFKNKAPITAQFYDVKKYWGADCWQKGGRLKQQLEETFDNYQGSIRMFNSANDSNQSIKELKLDDINMFDDRIKIAFEDSCSNIFLSVFRHIRNGFAHGRFFFYNFNETKMIFIEDKNNKKNVTARMTIPISTLLNWIDIIKSKE